MKGRGFPSEKFSRWFAPKRRRKKFKRLKVRKWESEKMGGACTWFIRKFGILRSPSCFVQTSSKANLDYSQIVGDAPRLQVFLEKQPFETETPKYVAAQKHKRIFGKFVNHAGEMSRQGQNIYSIRNSRKPSPSPVRDKISTEDA